MRWVKKGCGPYWSYFLIPSGFLVFVAPIPERSGRSKTPVVIQRLKSHLGQCPVRNEHGNPNPKSVCEVVSACFPSSCVSGAHRRSFFVASALEFLVSLCLSVSVTEAVASKYMFFVLRFFLCVFVEEFFFLLRNSEENSFATQSKRLCLFEVFGRCALWFLCACVCLFVCLEFRFWRYNEWARKWSRIGKQRDGGGSAAAQGRKCG